MLRKKLRLTAAAIESEAAISYVDDIVSGKFEEGGEIEEEKNRSKYFQKKAREEEMCGNKAVRLLSVSEQFLQLAVDLNESLRKLAFKRPVAYIYNPTVYAWEPYANYVKKYCNGPKKLLFVGMNPGPFGMCQTGVPFGEVRNVREWLKIEGAVDKPPKECPERPVLGFACERSEESGKRLWGYLRKICECPDNFFRDAFVYNFCPLAFLKENGGNLTPAEIKGDGEATKQLELLCNDMLFKVIKLLKAETIIGVGRYAENQCKQVLNEDNPLNARVLFMPHPSPRAAGNWYEKADKFFQQNNLLDHIKN